jgi:hypothetical protein
MKMKISICLIIISLFNACSTSSPDKKEPTGGTPLLPVVPVTPLTDTEALDLVQKMHLNIFGSMPIPFQSWLENAILLIILVLNPIS